MSMRIHDEVDAIDELSKTLHFLLEAAQKADDVSCGECEHDVLPLISDQLNVLGFTGFTEVSLNHRLVPA